MNAQQKKALALLQTVATEKPVTNGAAKLSDGKIYLLRLEGNNWKRASNPYGPDGVTKLMKRIESGDDSLTFEMPEIKGVEWVCGFKTQAGGGFQDL